MYQITSPRTKLGKSTGATAPCPMHKVPNGNVVGIRAIFGSTGQDEHSDEKDLMADENTTKNTSFDTFSSDIKS